MKNSSLFLTIGKTKESTETTEFKRYIGVGSSYVVAVNPTKKQLEEIYGREQANDPEYVVDTDNGKEARIHFIVKTDPATNNGIEIVSRLMFTLRNAPDYNRDNTKVRVIDNYGNTTWAPVEDAKAGKKLLSSNGSELKIDTKYRMACVGEADLVGFLKKYLRVEDAFTYSNGSWVKKPNADECFFGLDKIKDYFKGDFSELKEALALQPNNKVKLLYGVRTNPDDNKQYQAVASREEFILHNNAGAKAFEKLEKNLAAAKNSGSYPTTEFKVQELQEYSVEPTNLETPAASSDDPFDMPWN